jgi:arylsulfatase A-like enzyme
MCALHNVGRGMLLMVAVVLGTATVNGQEERPNIDRLANQGAMFTCHYAQSWTAGRAAFITGQHPFRAGLLTIGLPGSEHGMPDWAPTLADLLRPQGYTTYPPRSSPDPRDVLEVAHDL